MQRLILILFPLVLAAGCSSGGGGRIGDVAPVGSHQVVFLDPDDFDGQDREQVLEAVGAHLSAWESDFGGRKLRPTTVQVLDADEFECAGTMASGCTRADGTVVVVRGDRNSLPALYHEFCHRGPASDFYGPDMEHLNPAWASWTERSLRVAQGLVDRRGW